MSNVKTFYTLDFKTWGIEFEFKFEDMWLGLYWENGAAEIDIWVCLFPCFPIHFTIIKSES